MNRSVARAGAVAGWIALAGIFGYHIGLQLAAGQRVSGTLDPVAIEAYYQHSIVATASVEQFLVLIPVLVFVLALRQALLVNERARFLATLGLLFAVAEIPVILTEVSLQAALVATAQSDGDVIPLFRYWDVLYNSGAYALEAAYAVAFALAMRDVAAFPRWMPKFGLLVGALQLVNMTAIWVGLPDQATLVGNVAFAVWFAGGAIGLGRLASH